MIRKIIYRHNKKGQLIVAVLGAVCGLLLLMFSVQSSVDLDAIFGAGAENLLNEDHLVISKKMNILNTTDMASSAFSQTEMSKLEEQPFVSKIGQFRSGSFSVTAWLDKKGGIPPLRTELFFESVDEDLLDVRPEEFTWQPGDSIVPFILSTEYLALYNFGFAEGQGLPKLSQRTMQMVEFNLRLEGNGKSENWAGKIVGFSDRIHSILVPDQFLEAANERFSGQQEDLPNRLIIRTPDPADSRLATYLQEMGYVTNNEKLRSSKLMHLTQTIIKVVIGVGIVLLILTVLAIVQYVQVLVYRSEKELKHLLMLGMSHKQIAMRYVKTTSFFFLGAFLICGLTLYLTRSLITDWMFNHGYELPGTPDLLTFLAGIGIVLVMALMTSLLAFRQTRRLATPAK